MLVSELASRVILAMMKMDCNGVPVPSRSYRNMHSVASQPILTDERASIGTYH